MERGGRVDDDVQIAVEAEVLEAVVENEYIAVIIARSSSPNLSASIDVTAPVIDGSRRP
jgi:hypothetical protein